MQSGGGGTSYTLTVNVSPQGAGVVYLNPSQGVYTAGTQVELTAQANSGYVFSSWSGDLTGTQNPTTITMNSNKTVTANFVQSGGGGLTYTLSVNISPSTAGNVILNPIGEFYQAGTTVTITAVPNSNYTFSNWSGDISSTQNPISIVMDSNKNITANFAQDGTTYIITVNVSPSNAGFVTLNPAGGVYSAGTEVELVAHPYENYKFLNWSGAVTSTSTVVRIIVNSNKVVQANFVVQTSTGTASSDINTSEGNIIILNPSKNPFYLRQDIKVNLKYYLNKPLFVKIKIYDLSLNLVKTTNYEYKQSGENYFEFNGIDDNGELLPTGLYLYQVESETEKSKFGKLLIIK